MTSILGWPAFLNRVQNPYNWLLYNSVRDCGGAVAEFSLSRALSEPFDVLHVHWPEVAFDLYRTPFAGVRALATLTLIDILRRRGTKIVWTVHNLRSHDQRHPLVEKWFYKGFVKRLDGYIALSERGRQLAIDAHPHLSELPSATIPLGHFRGYYPDSVSAHQARLQLALPLSAPIIGSFGRIRAYKNLPELVKAFTALPDAEARLVLAGDLSPELNAKDLSGSRITLHPTHVEEARIQLYHRAVDLIVLPYRDILNSASAMLALSFDRPVLIPDTPTMRDLQEAVGSDWLLLYEPPLNVTTLNQALEQVRHRAPLSRPNLEALEWSSIAQKTLSFFRSLDGTTRVRSR